MMTSPLFGDPHQDLGFSERRNAIAVWTGRAEDSDDLVRALERLSDPSPIERAQLERAREQSCELWAEVARMRTATSDTRGAIGIEGLAA